MVSREIIIFLSCIKCSFSFTSNSLLVGFFFSSFVEAALKRLFLILAVCLSLGRLPLPHPALLFPFFVPLLLPRSVV